MAWSVPYTLLVVVLIAAPSLLARAVHTVTGDPLWQYLAIDEERIANAEIHIETDAPHVRVRIFWRGADALYATPRDLAHALRETFKTKGIEAFVATVEVPPGDTGEVTTIDFRAGSSRFGPFPASEAAHHIQPAVHAARFAHRPIVTDGDG